MPFDDLEGRITKTERRWRLFNTCLPASVVKRFSSIDWAREQRRRREEAQKKFESHIGDLHELSSRIESDVATLKNETIADPETHIQAISIRLDQAKTQLEIVETIDSKYLYSNELDQLEELSGDLDRIEDWLTAYESVGKHADIGETELNDVTESLDTYRGYGKYLTTIEERELNKKLSSIESTIKKGFDAARKTPLADEYLDQLTELQTQLNDYQDFVETYNSEFIAKEADRYEGLFTNIDEDNHDLSDEQRKAVLHDDKYNLVVAGAGSGKTVALTHRIAYLTQRNDSIPPERILAISYTNNAADVLHSRVKEKFGIADVKTKTFHSLGKEIVENESEIDPEVFLDRDRDNFVEDYVNREVEQDTSEFKRHYLQFLKHFYDDIETSADFGEKEDSVKEVIEDARVTLKQEQVRSKSEKIIADFLFFNQIEYEYRSLQEWVEEASGRGTYRADFYLPKYDTIISHRPLTADGRITDWGQPSSFQDLQTTIQWERERITKHDTFQLIETYEFEAKAGHLEQALEARLVDAGVVLDRMEYEDFIESAFNYSANESKIFDLFSSFINNARQLNLSTEELADRLPDDPPKEYAFGQCALILYRAYCEILEENDYIDFPGMLYEAKEATKNDPKKYENQYDQILVDEFQDISRAEVELLKCFVTEDNDTKLFCVGDDWQSIYSFAGSDVTYFLNFATYFGEPTVTELTVNYRCPPAVVNAGNDLIRNNDRQMDKTVRPAKELQTEIEVHDLYTSPSDRRYKSQLYSRVIELIKMYLASGASPDEIMLLSRTKSYYYDLIDRCSNHGINATMSPENEENPEEFVRLYSVHKSKGDEADHVIIIHAVEDMYGFPSQVEDDELLEPVRIAPETNLAEERRLFYVALTRASRTLDIVTSDDHRSRFVEEIEHHLSPPRNLANLTDDGDRIDINRAWLKQSFGSANSQTQAGILVDGFGSSRFVIWEDNQHDPLETGVEYEINNIKISYNDYQEEHEVHLDQYTEINRIGNREDSTY